MLEVAGRHLIANLITDRKKTTDQHKVTVPNNYTGLSKITDRITTIITNSKTFQNTCKFVIVGWRCRNETKNRPTVYSS